MRVRAAWRALAQRRCCSGPPQAPAPAASEQATAAAEEPRADGVEAPAVVQQKGGGGLSTVTSSLYELERVNQGGFGSASHAVMQRKMKRDALFSDPEFRDNQLGRIPDKQEMIKGREKDGNFERAMFMRNKKLMPGFVMLAALGFGGVTMYYTYSNEEKKFAKDFSTRSESAAYIGTAKLGGPIKLTDCATGKPVDSAVDLKGKWLYIYFGFTHCPDICPDEMNKLSHVATKMRGILGDQFQPLFVTVDPKRDDAALVKEYLMDYHPSIIGLVGNAEEIDQVAKDYRVFYAVPEVETFTPEDYLVDHSIMTYLMDPNGKFCDYTTKEYNVAEATAKVKDCVKKWEAAQIDRGIALQQHEGLRNIRM
eukprot:TRINITY_DN8788_c0_g1_i1.p1 TRINITY_DN8788_c0_g1~~TRINITY_DN8788_c0_g1_i1.p1  ORF type:complete len:367 (+),score=145.90 TRINITY_DN8788_c0_g1_i1:85-1185(+)